MSNRLKREHHDRAWHAWHIAAMLRAKKMPKLKELSARTTPKVPQKSDWRREFATFSAWASSFRGNT